MSTKAIASHLDEPSANKQQPQQPKQDQGIKKHQLSPVPPQTTANQCGNVTQSSGVKYHLIFSTGCSTYQDWQSYVFFYHALQSGQQGRVTRIASGCNKKNETEISPMSPDRFCLHLTPDFSTVKPGIGRYKYFSKPFGVRHWFQNALSYPKNHEEHDDTIIIFLDPDQIFLRPFTMTLPNHLKYGELEVGTRK